MALQNLDVRQTLASPGGVSRETMEAIIRSTPFASLMGASIVGKFAR